mmetsp:Transcript_17408/g.49113  ORF Transcript_17408/g.49113 Transcript_17408/m.49113 type:complete len:222 (-) Transcript_17408:1840-2505(-)
MVVLAAVAATQQADLTTTSQTTLKPPLRLIVAQQRRHPPRVQLLQRQQPAKQQQPPPTWLREAHRTNRPLLSTPTPHRTTHQRRLHQEPPQPQHPPRTCHNRHQQPQLYPPSQQQERPITHSRFRRTADRTVRNQTHRARSIARTDGTQALQVIGNPPEATANVRWFWSERRRSIPPGPWGPQRAPAVPSAAAVAHLAVRWTIPPSTNATQRVPPPPPTAK